MPHRVTAPGAALCRKAERGEAVQHLQAGESFDVLDISGGWCWGQVSAGGLVGYVPHAALEADEKP